MKCNIDDCEKAAEYVLNIEVYRYGPLDFIYCEEHAKEHSKSNWCYSMERIK